MKVKDIIKDDKFNEFLGYEIEAYNNRPAPQEGCRYRRTPYDALKDAGIFTVEGIRETFIKVANLESGLPKSQRDAITGLVFRVASTLIQVLKVKSLRGCEVKNWVGFQNGNGTDVGQDIERLIKRAEREQKYLLTVKHE